MEVKTYRGNEVNSILAEIRNELGDGAIILATRQLEENVVEIDVGLDIHAMGKPQLQTALPSQLGHEARSPQGQPDDEQQRAAALLPAVRRLVEKQGLRVEYARQILQALSGKQLEQLTLDRLVSEGLKEIISFDSRMPFRKRAIALLGPTGVGKTTTIAKLAAQLQDAFDFRIGLISVDSYRIGAGFQLHTYASLMQLPYRSIDPEKSFAEELRKALASFKDADIVFIDTAGCSARNREILSRMRDDFESFPEVERMLVLPAPSNDVDLRISAEAFGRVGFDRIILSKLDESGYIGPVINSAIAFRRPIAFFTTGQRVPEDIEPASARRLGWMLSRELH